MRNTRNYLSGLDYNSILPGHSCGLALILLVRLSRSVNSLHSAEGGELSSILHRVTTTARLQHLNAIIIATSTCTACQRTLRESDDSSPSTTTATVSLPAWKEERRGGENGLWTVGYPLVSETKPDFPVLICRFPLV